MTKQNDPKSVPLRSQTHTSMILLGPTKHRKALVSHRIDRLQIRGHNPKAAIIGQTYASKAQHQLSQRFPRDYMEILWEQRFMDDIGMFDDD